MFSLVYSFVQLIVYIFYVILYVICLLSQSSDVCEGMLAPFLDNYLDLEGLEIKKDGSNLINSLDFDKYLVSIPSSDVNVIPRMSLLESDSYDPFENINKEYLKSNKTINENNFNANSNLDYDILDLGGNRYILSNNFIFDSDMIKNLTDISLKVDFHVDSSTGNRVTNLTIDPEVANAFFSSEWDNPRYSGLSEQTQLSDREYEEAIRTIRTENVIFSSPEISEVLERGSFSIRNIPSISSELNSEDTRELEFRYNHRVHWRERLQILFSYQNPDLQPMPSWFEVPTRPSEPWAIEEWERDNVARRFWSKRLNGGYYQTNIIIKDSVNDSIVNNIDIFEQEEDIGLERLFSESNSDSSSSTSWMDEEEDLGLRLLYS